MAEPGLTTLRATASAGATVRRDGWRPDGQPGPWAEVLAITGADLRRANTGAVPLLLDHQATRSDLLIGTVEGARVENGKIVAEVRFSKEPAAQRYYRDVIDGIRNNLSVGYIVNQWRDDSKKGDRLPTFTAIDWELIELSLVNAGADPFAGFRSANTEPMRFRTNVDCHLCAGRRGGDRHQPPEPPRPACCRARARQRHSAHGRASGPAREPCPLADHGRHGPGRRPAEDDRHQRRAASEHCREHGIGSENSRLWRPSPSMANTPPAASARLARRSNW